MDLNCGHQKSYIHASKASTDKSFVQSRDWLDAAVAISASKYGNTTASATRISNHVFKYYRDSAVSAAENSNVPICEPMAETQYAAMLKAAGMNFVQQEEIAKHLRYHLGKEILPPKNRVAMKCEGHTPVFVGSKTIQFKDRQEKKKVEYSIKNLDKELTNQLDRLLQNKKIKPEDVENIWTLPGGDHGDVAASNHNKM
ncbi:hypothetical protein ACHAWF_003483 [Thalassiosira exigua]